MNSITRILVLLLSFILITSGCSTDKPRQFRIGVSQCSNGPWREKQNREMERELLLHDNVSMDLICAEDDNERQIADIQHFIDEKYDLIIVSPNEPAPLTDIISKAYRSGIPVVLFDRRIEGTDYTAFVGGDNTSAGRLLAEYAASQKSNGQVKVIELMGHMQTTPAILRHQGFISELANHPEIQLLASVDAAWDGDCAMSITDSLLAIYPDVDVIVAHSDWMAQWASVRAAKAHPAHRIAFAGIDGWGGEGEGVEAVAIGRLDATATYPTGGDIIIQTALQILEGKTFVKELYLESNLIANRQEAELTISMKHAIDHEVATIKKLKERVDKFLQQLNLEKTVRYALIAILLLALLCIFILAWLLITKRKLSYSQPKPIALVIDPSEEMRKTLATMLGDRYRIISATSGQKGIVEAQHDVADVVLVSDKLPDMTGDELREKLANNTVTSHIPVLTLSDTSGSETLMKKIEATPAATTSPLDQEFLTKLHAVVDKNLADENFNVEKLSSEMCLSRTQLFRKCKALTGESPVELIRNARLNKAKQFLEEGHSSIAEVASMAGFADASYFSRCYKAYFGTTPHEIIKQKY